mmetsp:Transcript_41986/g.132356  ORF Transcript_41986/g.132356 Transcript_41986/m.132356 type:complete len:210 (-) Transcript_41986:1870-2499(-)
MLKLRSQLQKRLNGSAIPMSRARMTSRMTRLLTLSFDISMILCSKLIAALQRRCCDTQYCTTNSIAVLSALSLTMKDLSMLQVSHTLKIASSINFVVSEVDEFSDSVLIRARCCANSSKILSDVHFLASACELRLHPASHASSRALLPSLSTTLVSHPLSRRYRTTSGRPEAAATSRGVLPPSNLVSKSAQPARRYQTMTSRRPSLHAT